MSEIKVNSIKGVGASTAAITVNNTDGTCTANITNNLSNRNLIINGAMQVAQRGTSSTGNLYQTIDRIRTSSGNLGSITLTQSQQQLASSDTPYSSGFRHFYRAALSGAGTVNTNGYIGISTRLEAQNIAQSGWNYTSASSNITLQFWFRCSTNQTFYAILETSDGTAYSYPFAFTASGNNAWTKITKTIPGNSNLQFDLNADRGLKVGFTPWYGTDYTGSKTADAWSAYSGSAEYPDYASTWLTAGASTFDITGVQLEVGSVATDFEHCSYADELRKCQRYYYRVGLSGGVYYGGDIAFGFTDNDNDVCTVRTEFQQQMRAAPTAVEQTGTGSDYKIRVTTTQTCDNVPVFVSATAWSAKTSFRKSGHGFGTAVPCFGQTSNSNSFLAWSSEL